MQKPSFIRAALVLALAAGLPACEADELLGPDAEEVAGSYTATEFSITTGSGSQDLLDLGGHIFVTLNVDGTTEGDIVMPAVGDDDALNADLEGTWDIVAGVVVLSHDADTILRDVVFEYENGRLVASEVFTDGLVEIVLTRPAI